jgi:hypothetical protein
MIPIFVKAARMLPTNVQLKVIGVGIVALAIGAFWLHYQGLKHDLRAALLDVDISEAQINLKQKHILELRDVVSDQNQQVKVLAELAQLRDEQLRGARKNIDVLQKAISEDIYKLRKEVGSACSDGIALIDRELGL